MTITAIAVALALIAGSIAGYVAIRRLQRHEEAKAAQRIRSLAAAIELTEILDRQCGRPPRAAGSHSQPWRNRRVS